MATVEATTQKVQRILTSELNDVRLTKNGFAIEHGSTACFIEILEWVPDNDGNPRSLVHIWAPLGREVKPTLELYRWAATEGQNTHFGSVSVIERDGGDCLVMFDATLLGDYIDPAELMTAAMGVIFSADQLDDVVRDRFGGKRYTD